jgi:alanyl-tRNA synthetase
VLLGGWTLVDLAKFVQDIAPTDCVYLDDSYLQSLNSNVAKAVQEKKDAYVLLDRTIFHPRSGGQPSDVGTIESSQFRVHIKRAMLQSGIIVHFGKVEGKLDTGFAKCNIDWANRFLMMRRHTAAHLLDHCLATHTGSRVQTTDSWLGEDPFVGYGGNPPSDFDLKRLQELGNGFIQRGLNVEIKTWNRAEAEQLIGGAPNLARLPKTEKLRIVTIEGQIPIPCGGTHVKNLKEIGALEVTKVEPAEMGFRVHFEVK